MLKIEFKFECNKRINNESLTLFSHFIILFSESCASMHTEVYKGGRASQKMYRWSCNSQRLVTREAP